jgi:cation-transporting ATPase E
VGAANLANQITAGARAFRQVKTPLQRDIDYVIRLLVILVGQLGLLLAISFALKEIPVAETVQMAAVIVALVPQGLLVATTVTYAMGAVRMAGKGALVQQANAVESLSNVNVLCLDKTGTLTTNRIAFHELHPLCPPDVEITRILGDYAASTAGGNRTVEALSQAFRGQARHVREAVPFSSARKWSALAFDDEALGGIYVLGAPEVLRPHLRAEADWSAQAEEWAARGLRVLLFAQCAERVALNGESAEPQLPARLAPMALLAFSDELRAEAQGTLQDFAAAGIQIKIISGDHPQTVAALAAQAGMGRETRVISGLELAEMEEIRFAQASAETTIFGRITPQQKERLVRALRKKGSYVAMIGDGVNDVLSLKEAQLGIAMQSGSAATRTVADMVLLNDSFGVLPSAFREGQRIVRGMQDVLRLLLARTFYVSLLIVGAAVVGAPFPVLPKHNFILALLTVGIPTLVLVAWARPALPPRRILSSVTHFVFPAAFSVAALSLGVYLIYWLATGDAGIARTAVTTITVLCGLLLIPFVEPPTQAWVGGDEFSGDWRPSLLALALLALYGMVLAVPPLRAAFELASLRARDVVLLCLAAAVWAVALRAVWRARLFERLILPDPSGS